MSVSMGAKVTGKKVGKQKGERGSLCLGEWIWQ